METVTGQKLAIAGLEPGSVLLGKYRVERTLGVGGWGIVVEATNLALGERVAIKLLREDVELDHENVSRFLREAQAVVRLKSEHVIRINDVGTTESGAPYMVMEMLDGQDLGKLVASAGPLDAARAAEYLLHACDALAEAHSAGIIHRDIKSTNLMLATRADGTPRLKVLDFGVAKAIQTDLSLTQTASFLGTPAFMSPEQMRSARDVDARTDIWALGVVLFELLEGDLPFPAQSFAELCVQVATEPVRTQLAPPPLAAVITRCLAKQPADRFQNVAELAVELAPFVPTALAQTYLRRIHRVLELGVPTAFASQPRLPRIRRSRAPWIALGVAAATVAGAVVTFALTRDRDEPVRPFHVEVPRAAAAAPVAPAPAPPPPAPSPPAPPVPAPPSPPHAKPVSHAPAPHRPPPVIPKPVPSTPPPPPCDPYATSKAC